MAEETFQPENWTRINIAVAVKMFAVQCLHYILW
jgi:hypothetical protein